MDTRQNIILILASVGTFVEALDIAIINLTIPSIQQQFQIGAETVQWLQTLYMLFFGGFLIIGGKLSDQIGRKKIFLLGVVVFMLTSLGAGLSKSLGVLAVFRSFQGIGAALVMPSALSIITYTFREEQNRSRAIGIFSSFAALGSGSGLSVGGVISTYFSWHWVFLINVPILLITLILSYYYLPTDEKSKTVRKSDMGSGILLVFGLLGMTYGTHELVNISEHPVLITGSLILAFLLLVRVYYILKSVPEPLVDLQLFKYRSLVVSNGVFFTLGAFFIGFLFLISLMLQKDMGYSAASSGLMLVPFNVISALTAKFILPKVSKRLKISQMGVLGWLFMLMGGILLLISVHIGHPLILVLLGVACISGVGMTFCFTALSVIGIQEVGPLNYGLASSLSSTSYFLGAGISLSFITLMSQIFPSELSVGSLNFIILIGYAFTALGILFYFICKNLQ